MNIQEALEMAKKYKKTISSEEARLYAQKPSTLLYWLLEDKDNDNCERISTLIRILSAIDWKLDK